MTMLFIVVHIISTNVEVNRHEVFEQVVQQPIKNQLHHLPMKTTSKIKPTSNFFRITFPRSSSTNRQLKKDPHRHSLDGYDLNNVAGNSDRSSLH